jgi:hypothetical protein
MKENPEAGPMAKQIPVLLFGRLTQPFSLVKLTSGTFTVFFRRRWVR